MTPSPALLSDHLDHGRNSFNLLRLVAAFAVLVSHSFLLTTGESLSEPLAQSTPFTLGQHAVNAFFVISGITLAHSLTRSSDLVQYAWARFLRILPALFVYGLVLSFLAGPLLTSLTLIDYFTDRDTWLYPISVLVNFSRAVPPHAVFTHGPFVDAANNPLWTIKYELFAYAALAAFFWCGVTRRPRALAAVLMLALVVFVLTSPAVHQARAPWIYQLGRYEACFMLGVLACHYADRIQLKAWLLLPSVTLALLLNDTRLEGPAFLLMTAHLVIVLGSRSYGAATTFTQRNDLSYGSYIYGWPVQQALLLLLPGLSIAALAAVSMAIVPPFAVLSWFAVEKQALRLKRISPRALFVRSQAA